MEESDGQQEPSPEQPLDPIIAVQNAIAAGVDDGSMLTGYVVVAEWIEPDGSNSISVFHTPMPHWHLYGLMSYGRDVYASPEGAALVDLAGEDDDDF